MEKLTQSKLTIILQYKNRFDFICRWLKFAYRQSCPFEIIIADGSKTEILKNYIEKNKFNKKIKIRYIKTQFDKTIYIYYEKIINALQKVNTPYVLLADDDDFYNFDNIQKCVDKLDSDKRIVTCGAQIGHFKILDGDLNGKKIKLDIPLKRNFCNSSFMKNIQEYFLQPKGIYYSIHRLKDYKRAWLITAKYKFTPRMLELFVELYLFTCGRIEILPETFYYRQYEHSTNNSANLSNDFLDEVLRFNWYRDVNLIFDIISKRIAKIENNNHKMIKEELIFYYKKFLTPYVINNLKVQGSSNLTKLARNNMIKIALKEGNFKLYYEFFKIIRLNISYLFNYRKTTKTKDKLITEFLRNYKN